MALKNGFLSLMAAVIIVGGIISGIFTATESGVIACLYALVLTIFHYKELKISQLPEILQKVAITCGMVFFLVSTSSAFGWIMAYEHIPQFYGYGGFHFNTYTDIFTDCSGDWYESRSFWYYVIT